MTTAIAVVASLGLLLPGTPTVAAGAEQPRLSIAPAQGPAGSDATVDGAGFTDGRAVEIRWEPTGQRLGTATGPAFSTTVSIPDDAANGSHALEARGQPSEAGASEAGHATTRFTVTASGAPDDAVADEDDDDAVTDENDDDNAVTDDDNAVADEDRASKAEQADDGDTDTEGDGTERDGGEDGTERDGGEDDPSDDPSAESDDSEAGDDESAPSEEPQSTDGDAEDGSGDAEDGSGDAEDGSSGADFSSGTPQERESQRTNMSPDPDDDSPEEPDGQDADSDERDTDRSDSSDGPAAVEEAEQSDTDQRDAERDTQERDTQADESGDPTEAPTGKAETATAPSRDSEDDDDASSSDEDRSSATFRKSSEGPPAAVSHEVGPVQPSAVEETPDVDFAAAPDSEAQFQDALPPQVAAAGRAPAQPGTAVRERLATAGGSRHTPTEAKPSTPQGTPAAVGTQAAAPNSEEISLLVLLAASGALLVWHRRRQPLVRRR